LGAAPSAPDHAEIHGSARGRASRSGGGRAAAEWSGAPGV